MITHLTFSNWLCYGSSFKENLILLSIVVQRSRSFQLSSTGLRVYWGSWYVFEYICENSSICSFAHDIYLYHGSNYTKITWFEVSQWCKYLYEHRTQDRWQAFSIFVYSPLKVSLYWFLRFSRLLWPVQGAKRRFVWKQIFAI